MLDSYVRPIIDPILNKLGRFGAGFPISSNAITVIGFIIGIIGCYFAFANLYIIALIFVVLNRLIDGLDGPIARSKNQSSDFGGYLDIVLDFQFYAGFPLAFALGIGTSEALMAGAFVLFTIIGTGTSFLAYAIICAKRGLQTERQGKKTFYFSNGLMEGTETILFLIFLCLFPADFVYICTTFGVLCMITTAQRIYTARKVFQ